MSTTAAPPPASTTVPLRRHRDFRRFFVGMTVSRFGSEISEIAVPLLLIGTLGATAAEVGLARAAQFAPFLLLTLHAGLLVDRLRRRPLMIIADLGRFAVIAAIPVLVWLGWHRVEPVILLVFAAGLFTVIHQIAEVAYVPTLVGNDRVLAANSGIGAAQAAAGVSGQGIGGLLVAWLTAPFAVLVDALTYLVSGAALVAVRTREPAPRRHRDGARSGMWRDIGEGFGYVFRSRYLRPLLAEAATFNLAHETFMIGLLLWLARDLGMSAALIGLVITLAAAGSFVGAAVGARLSTRYGFGRTMLVTLLLGNTAPVAVVWAGDGGPGTVAVLGAVFVVMGFGVALANVHNLTLRQTTVPDRLRGRVNATYRLVSWGALPVGAGLGGVLASHLGSRTGTLLGAVGIATATLWVAFSTIPRLRQAPVADEDPAGDPGDPGGDAGDAGGAARGSG